MTHRGQCRYISVRRHLGFAVGPRVLAGLLATTRVPMQIQALPLIVLILDTGRLRIVNGALGSIRSMRPILKTRTRTCRAQCWKPPPLMQDAWRTRATSCPRPPHSTVPTRPAAPGCAKLAGTRCERRSPAWGLSERQLRLNAGIVAIWALACLRVQPSPPQRLQR
jgi:hypothetical protein